MKQIMNKLPRSLRNNNLFNIKKSSSRWLGKVKGDDKVFETFDTLEHGTRAGLKLLSNYVKKGFNTPRKIIERFAPPSENDTSSYIAFVCHGDIVYCDKVLCHYDDFLSFCLRIISYESGVSVPLLSDYGITLCFLHDVFIKYNLNF